MILATDSHDEVPADDAAAHRAVDQEAQASEHPPLGRIGHTRERASEPSGERLVEGHRSIA